MHSAPVQPFQQSAQLRRRQPHHAILNAGPLEASLFEPLGHQAQAGAVPPDQFYPVRPLRPEHINHPGKGLPAIIGGHQSGQGIWPFAKVHGTRCNHDAGIRPRTDHRARLSASITAPITPASAPWAIFTATPSITSSTAAGAARRLPCLRRRGAGSADVTAPITAGTNMATAGSTAGRLNPLTSVCANPSATHRSARDQTHPDARQR